MNPELLSLYQEVIIDHGKNPRNLRSIDNAKSLEGFNPLCGDRLKLYVKVDENNVIEDVAFTGSGCAISMASASLMSEHIKGKHTNEAEKIFHAFHHLLTQDDVNDIEHDCLGKLQILSGVKAFPMRVKCATLAWHTLDGILHDSQDAITTEDEA